MGGVGAVPVSGGIGRRWDDDYLSTRDEKRFQGRSSMRQSTNYGSKGNILDGFVHFHGRPPAAWIAP